MPRRNYCTVYYEEISTDSLFTSKVHWFNCKARNCKEAAQIGSDFVAGLGSKFDYSETFSGTVQDRVDTEHRQFSNSRMHLEPGLFLLRHRHKGRPIRGKRNCPLTKKIEWLDLFYDRV